MKKIKPKGHQRLI